MSVPWGPTVIALTVFVLLVGCAVERFAPGDAAADDIRCQGYGTKPGTHPYAECRKFLAATSRR